MFTCLCFNHLVLALRAGKDSSGNKLKIKYFLLSSASATHLQDWRNRIWMLPSSLGTWDNFLVSPVWLELLFECLFLWGVCCSHPHLCFLPGAWWQDNICRCSAFIFGIQLLCASPLLGNAGVSDLMNCESPFCHHCCGWSIEQINPKRVTSAAARFKVVTKPTQRRGNVWVVTSLCFWLRLLIITCLKWLQGMSTGYLFYSRAFDQLLHCLK